MKKVVVFGEALIDFIPSERGTPLKDVATFYRNAGGAPANVAAAIGKLGGAAVFVGQVGDDAFGQHLREVLHATKVDTKHMKLSTTYPTALAFITLRDDGERDIMFMRRNTADLRLRMEEIDPRLFEGVSILHLGSNLFMDDEAYRLSCELVTKAKEQGVVISYDPNLRPLLWENQQIEIDKVLSIMSQVDILKVSEEELFPLTGMQPSGAELSSAVGKLASMGPKIVLVTLGDKGCYYEWKETLQSEGRKGFVTGCNVQTVDTTGAGDAFIGGFLYRLSTYSSLVDSLTVETLEEDLRFANAVGGLTTEKPGAIHGLPSLEEVSKLLGK